MQICKKSSNFAGAKVYSIMKNRLFVLLSVMFFATALYAAGDHKYDGTTFTISSNVALPVKVRYNGSVWTINSRQYTTTTRIPNATITDAHGNSCMYRHSYDQNSGSKGNYVHHYYEITGVYSSSSSSSSSSSRSSSSSSSYSSSSRAAELGANWARAASATKVYDYYDNYYAGGFSLAASVSAAWGENLELRFRYGSSSFGGDITGMVGYDWINGQYGDQITWNVGIGAYFGGRPSELYLWDVDFGIKFGKSNIPYNYSWTMLADLSTTHLIGPQHVIGLIAGAGIGLAGDRPKFAWDVRGGIVIYFLQWNWF